MKPFKKQWTKQKPNRAATQTHPAAVATKVCGRELALLAVCAEEGYLSDFFEGQRHPFAEELAFGAMRWKRALEKQIRERAQTGKMKKVIRWIVVLGLYERHFISKSPDYAKVHPWVELSKKYGRFQAGLVNALLRADYPTPAHADAFPPSFIEQVDDPAVLEVLNTYPKPYARKIGTDQFITDFDLKEIARDPGYYIQNPTPYHLMHHLKQHSLMPKRILDLCAAPGGKTLILRDLFPKAHIDCYDISPKRMVRLRENLEKYGVEVGFFDPEVGGEYDLVVVDAPCSSSGVMHKKPEARHRLESVEELVKTQNELIEQAKKLGKSVWYLTCSLLSVENHPGKHSILQLPTKEGLDGGYAAIIG